MIILEEPFVSQMLIAYIEKHNIPVLQNKFTKQFSCSNINLLAEADFIEQYEKSKKIYSVSEYALEWIDKSLHDNNLNTQIDLLKNKAAFRAKCSHLYTNFFFKELSYIELCTFDISQIQVPVVLKPTVGFFSAGVFIIQNKNDWKQAIDAITNSFFEHALQFPDTVVGSKSFILESYIKGREFAIDLYFANNEPVIISIFEHLFSSEKDVSDRLYITSKTIFDEYLQVFTDYMKKINQFLVLDNIPVHVELRIDGENIMPIEINPLRFTGLCLNEISFYITGIHPLHYFMSNTAPNYSDMWIGKEEEIYCFSIIEKPKRHNSSLFDLEAVTNLYSHILELRMLTHQKLDIHAFIFSKTTNKQELDNILNLKI